MATGWLLVAAPLPADRTHGAVRTEQVASMIAGTTLGHSGAMSARWLYAGPGTTCRQWDYGDAVCIAAATVTPPL